MRLWHYEIIPYLPDSQLLAQKREVDLIWKDIFSKIKTNHILINYIWDYPDYKYELSIYYKLLSEEFKKRGFKFVPKGPVSFSNDNKVPFKEHHNKEYLEICFYNLKEKYLRGQKDFDEDRFNRLKERVIV